jgi:hypothetical protein
MNTGVAALDTGFPAVMMSRMPTRMAQILVAAVALTGLAGCSSEAPTAPAPAAPPSSAAPAPDAPAAPGLVGAVYTSPDGYSISPPAGWREFPLDKSSGISSAFAATQLDKGTAQPFAANLNVVITPETRPLDVVIAQSKAQYPSILRNYKVVIDQPAGDAAQPAHVLGGTYDDQHGALQNVQLVTLKDGKQYTVSHTSSAASFGALTETFKASLNTFALGG